MKNEVSKIGLVIADPNEIHDIKDFIFVKRIEDKFITDIYQFKNIQIFTINSKIGLVNASITTQYLIDKFDVSQIWNYGAVASLGKAKLYEVVIPQKFFYHDVTTPWYPRGQIPGENNYYLNSLIVKENNNSNIASGNSFVVDVDYIKVIQKELDDIDLIDMESCAIAHVCMKNNIEFFCVKAVSDVVGQNLIEKEKINNSITKASKKALEKMIKYIKIVYN